MSHPLTGPLPLTRLYPQTPPQLAAVVALVQLLAWPLPDRTTVRINHRGAVTLYVDEHDDARQLAERMQLVPVIGGRAAREWEGLLPLGVPVAVQSVAPAPDPQEGQLVAGVVTLVSA